MKELFYMGGPLFMGLLTTVLIVMIAWAIFHFMPVAIGKEYSIDKTRARLQHIRTIGLFALVTGILGQLIGFYQAFIAIEQAGDVSPALLIGGLKVSLITTLYGIFIYLLSLLLWIILDYLVSRRMS